MLNVRAALAGCDVKNVAMAAGAASKGTRRFQCFGRLIFNKKLCKYAFILPP
jgi:hypothetical protein